MAEILLEHDKGLPVTRVGEPRAPQAAEEVPRDQRRHVIGAGFAAELAAWRIVHTQSLKPC